jgi:dihydrofolate reductase
MGKLVHFVHQSADGRIEGPNGEFDWASMGPELSDHSGAMDSTTEVFLYGRVVWEMMSGYWPKAEELDDHPHTTRYAPIWRAKPKVVVSRTLTSADWNTRVVSSIADLAALKDSLRGDLALFGGSSLAGSLTEAGLIDEYQVFVHPVVLGGGKPVFGSSERFGLELVESKIFDGSIVQLRYTRAGH